MLNDSGAYPGSFIEGKPTDTIYQALQTTGIY